MAMGIKRFDVFLISLGPTLGREIKKTRPCLVISPDEMNEVMSTVIIIPMTTKSHQFPTRIPVSFQGKDGWIVVDQLRAVNKERLITCLGSVGKRTQEKTCAVLGELFAY